VHSKRFEYRESPEYRYEPEALDRSDASITSVFIAPSKGAKKNMDRLVKIKKKVLNPTGDNTHDFDFSSMAHYSKSMTGDGQFKDSIATLSMDHQEDDPEDFKNASRNISKEILFNSAGQAVRDYKENLLRERDVKYSSNTNNTKSREKFEYHQSNEEVFDPKVMDSVTTIRAGVHNMVVSDQIHKEIEEKKTKVVDYKQHGVDKIDQPSEVPDPNKNMINLENIIII
jgi:hypothetical protein